MNKKVVLKVSIEMDDPFNLENCTEEELRARCKERIKVHTDYLTDQAIKHFVLKLRHDEIDNNPRKSEKERERLRKMLK